jgi:tetratricopeptide (TPR) repeat protein
MWWLWPHFRRLWAAAGAIAVGLAVNYLYGLLGNQSVPDLQRFSHFLWGYWEWAGGSLVILAIVSVFAERAHRRHEAPHFIGTAPGRRGRKGAKLPPLPASITAASTLMVGREGELTQLRDWFASVLRGERRVVFVSGEAGIGKTTFVRAFLDSLEKDGAVRIARGQCVEQYGAGEPYMPMLEALTQLGRGPESQQLLAILHRLAPAWLAQLPALLTAAERARIQGETQGLTQQRMLREMAETLAAIAADAPLVLLLEDLHWSDASTLDLIAALARRTEPARLLILGTYRPVEMLAGDHPLRALKQELELHGHCHELRLKLLNEAEVAAYLSQRFANDGAQYGGLAPAIYQRTEGNALFMVNVIDYLAAQGPQLDASKIETPRNIRQMIERNLERLTPDEQSVLESASVAGAEFSTAAVAAALDRPVSEVEACCTRLSRQERFVAAHGMSEWPDGTVASSFRFHHALYRDVLYDRVPAGHRVELHRQIAVREETAYGEQAGEIAAELANHYGRANEKDQAVKYFQLAGERASVRGAMVEAALQYACALELLREMPEAAERDRRELTLQVGLGTALFGAKSWAHPEALSAFARAQELAEKLGETQQLIAILHGLFLSAMTRGQVRASQEFAERMLRLAESGEDRGLLCAGHSALGYTLWLGGKLREAQKHLESARSYFDEADARSLTRASGIAVGALQNTLLLGFPDRARQLVGEAVRLAERLKNSYYQGLVYLHASGVYLHLRDPQALLENAEAMGRLAKENPTFAGQADEHAASALLMLGRREEAMAGMRRAMDSSEADGLRVGRTRELMFEAQFFAGEGRVAEALAKVAEALHETEEVANYRPWVLRLRGDLLVQSGARASEVETVYREALECARAQDNKWDELRSTTNFARWLKTEGRASEARAMLSEIYNWFTEGFDTADLKEAKALLADLSAPAHGA